MANTIGSEAQMIPLRLKADAPDATVPFVTRVRISSGLREDDDAIFISSDEGVHFVTRHGPLSLSGVEPVDIDGDVLFVDPIRQIAHRLIRANSRHNTLLVTEQCDQLCVMCSQPPKRQHVDMFDVFAQAIRLAPIGATIGLSGGEPTLHKADLFTFLENAIADRDDLQFHILSNGQHFDELDFTRLRAIPTTKIEWGIPLYSSDAQLHDEIVKKEGAFEKVIRSFDRLAKTGSRIELRTVVMRNNVVGLPQLAEFISQHLPYVSVWALMQLENIGFGRMNWNELFFDNSIQFSDIGATLDIAQARGTSARLYNFPRCTIPKAYRHLAPPTISDWKQRFLDKCEGCDERASCSGFFEWHPETNGYSQIGLIGD